MTAESYATDRIIGRLFFFFVKGSRVSAIPAPSAGQVEGHEVAGSSGVETCLSGDPVYLVLHGVLVDEQRLTAFMEPLLL